MRVMTTRALIPLMLLTALAPAGCSSGPHVRVHATSGIDFTKYRTYAIKPGNVVYPGAPEAEREEIARRIQDAVGGELEARGLVPQPEQPDLVVTYTASAQAQKTSGASARAAEGVDVRGPGGNPYDEPGMVRPREWPDAAADQEFRRRYVEGNLVIDLLDGKTRRLAWRAMADAELASDRRGRVIEQIVSKAFEQLPLGRGAAIQPPPTTRP
jgi:hypothetical protein